MGWEVSLIIPLIAAAMYLMTRKRKHGVLVSYTLMAMLAVSAYAASHMAAYLNDTMTAALMSLAASLTVLVIFVFMILEAIEFVKMRW